jgi:hypothetical protein
VAFTFADERVAVIWKATLFPLSPRSRPGSLLRSAFRFSSERVHSVALRYGKGDPAAAAIYLPTLIDQAHWLGLFANPMAPPISAPSSAPSIAISSSRH